MEPTFSFDQNFAKQSGAEFSQQTKSLPIKSEKVKRPKIEDNQIAPQTFLPSLV